MDTEEQVERMKCSNCIHLIKKDNKCYCNQRFTKKGVKINEDGTHEDFQEYEPTNEDSCCSWFTDNSEEKKEQLREIYLNIIDILKKYLDMEENYYSVIAFWIMGTYLHEQFPAYPYLYFNAIRGSGKTRVLKLITKLSKDGEMLNSLTEAVLFRTKGTLGIDEFEGISRKGNEALRELLNSAYKKGTKVKRLKKMKTLAGEEQVVEEFDVYRPIHMANIWGLVDEALKDRCITLILEKSNKGSVVNLIELFDHDSMVMRTLELIKCSLCSVVVPWRMYMDWNDYVTTLYTKYINYTNYTNYTKDTKTEKEQFYDKILGLGINGRELELSFPLIIISEMVGETDNFLEIIKSLFIERREEETIENNDISLVEFISKTENLSYYTSVKKMLTDFREFLGEGDDDDRWLNEKWLGRALKRLKLIIKKRRVGKGVEVVLNVPKAKEKYKIFLSEKIEEDTRHTE